MVPPSPFGYLRLGLQMGVMMTEAQMVIGMRMLGLMGMWRVSPGENTRMITEKLVAAQQAGLAATRATLAGKPPEVAATLALKPVRRRTRSNVIRLARKGPGKP